MGRLAYDSRRDGICGIVQSHAKLLPQLPGGVLDVEAAVGETLYMIDSSVQGFFSTPLGFKYFMHTTIA